MVTFDQAKGPAIKYLRKHADDKSKELRKWFYNAASMLIGICDEFDKDLDISKIAFPNESKDVEADFVNIMKQFTKDVKSNPPLKLWETNSSGLKVRTNLPEGEGGLTYMIFKKAEEIRKKEEEEEKKAMEKAKAKEEPKQDEVPPAEDETEVSGDTSAAMSPKAEASILDFMNKLQGEFAKLLEVLSEDEKKELNDILAESGLNSDLIKEIKELIKQKKAETEVKAEGNTVAAMTPNFSGFMGGIVPNPAGYTPQQAAMIPEQGTLTPQQRQILLQQQAQQAQMMTSGLPVPIPVAQPQQPAMSLPVQQMPVAPPVQPQTVVSPAVHRVDQPQQQKQPKGQEDKNVIVKLGKIDVSGLKEKKTKSEVPEPIKNELPKCEPVVDVKPLEKNSQDNSAIIKKYSGGKKPIPLAEIEKIANQNACNVWFHDDIWNGIICVNVADENGVMRPEKCFSIDPGMIIDNRVKLSTMRDFDTGIIELSKFFELFVNDNGKKVLDKKLINDIMIAGLGNIQKREMYSEEYKRLNTKVALITMPLKGLNADDRKALQDFLIQMDKKGYLDKALTAAPCSRFVFEERQLNRNHLGNFTLINCKKGNPSDSVPVYYGANTVEVNPIRIKVTNGEVQMEGNVPLKPVAANGAA